MNILIFALKDGAPFAERAKEAGTVTLLGMAAIFVVLSLLWGVIEILHKLLGGAEPKKAKKNDKNKPEAEISQTPVETVPAETAAEDDGALIAAITAAISDAMSEEGYTGGFRVVSFKRAPARRNGRA